MKKHILILAVCSTLFTGLAWAEPEQSQEAQPQQTEAVSCPPIESVNNTDLDTMLKNVDDSLKGLVITMAKDSEKLGQESVKLGQTFSQLYDFMKQAKDLRKNKAAILEKKESAAKQNDSVLGNLEQINGLFENTKQELETAYCSVGGLYNYFDKVATTTTDPQTRKAAETSRNQLQSKVKKLEKIMGDFEKFFTQLDAYTGNIKISSEFLVQFANSVIAFENVTCKEKQKEACIFPSSDIQGLLTKQKDLVKMNETFLNAKKELLKRSLDWGNLNEKK